MQKPKNALALARLSDLREMDLDEEGKGKGTVDQDKRIRDHGARIGWNITKIIIENDLVSRDGKQRGVSAFKRRKILLPNGRYELRTVRPGFRQALELLASGTHDGLIALDLDRTVRDPRDLEDLIDVVEEHKIPVESVTGSLRLSNDAEITMARVLVAMGNKSSRDTARRVAAARERQALAGEYGGGRRPYGWEADGTTIREREAKIVTEMADRVVQEGKPDSLRMIAADLRKREIPTVTGAAWSSETVRDILLRPRNAGFMVYREEEVGDAPWKEHAPVKLETFRAVQRILTDPSRRLGPGPAPKWVGSGIYFCGICTDARFTTLMTVEVTTGSRGTPRYKCKENNHLTRGVKKTDLLVVGAVLERLSMDDAAGLLAPEEAGLDLGALRAEATAIRTNLNEMAADKALGLIDRGQLIAASTKGRARLDEIDKQLQAAIVESPLKPLIGTSDINAAWEALPLGQQRMVIDMMLTVRILGAKRRGAPFDPTTVEIRWRKPFAVAE